MPTGGERNMAESEQCDPRTPFALPIGEHENSGQGDVEQQPLSLARFVRDAPQIRIGADEDATHV